MICIICTECNTAVRVSGDHEEVNHLFGELNTDWYPNNYPCPNTDCTEKAKLLDSVDSAALKMLDVYDLTVHEAYAALHGLGLPEERDCGPSAVREQLLNNKVVEVDARLIKGSNRSVVYKLIMENGTVLFLGSSPYGATVYRIAKARSAVEQFDEG